MLNVTFKCRCFLTAAILLAALLIPALPGQAQWMWAHGTAGQIQTTANLEAYTYIGWGLDFVVKQNQSTWVHFPIPTIGTKTRFVRDIKFCLWTASDVAVSTINVRNSYNNVAKEFTGPWTGNYTTIKGDLGKKYNFSRGLVISMLVQAGSSASAGDRRIIIGSAGANFVSK